MKAIRELTYKDLISIEVGGAICLPIIMVGQKLSNTVGFAGSVGAILAGNLILFALAIITARMSYSRKKNTPENAENYLGPSGVKVLAAVLYFAKCCWFALQLNLMSLTVIKLLEPWLNPGHFALINIVCGVLIAAITMVGITAVSRFSAFCLPLMIATMAYSLFGADLKSEFLHPINFSLGAVAIVMGAPITAVIDMPSYFSQSRSQRDSMIAVCVMFLAALPAVECVGVYLASGSVSGDLLDAFMQVNNPLWNLWITLFIILAAWTTNTTNLYSATICLGSLMRHTTHRVRCAATAVVAIAISLGNILDHFTLFINLLVVIVGSIGAAILSAYCRYENRPLSAGCQLANLIGGIVGGLCGTASILQVFSICNTPIVDAFCVSFVSTAALNKLFANKQEVYENVA